MYKHECDKMPFNARITKLTGKGAPWELVLESEFEYRTETAESIIYFCPFCGIDMGNAPFEEIIHPKPSFKVEIHAGQVVKVDVEGCGVLDVTVESRNQNEYSGTAWHNKQRGIVDFKLEEVVRDDDGNILFVEVEKGCTQ